MKKSIYSLLMCLLLLGTTPNIKTSHSMDYICLITNLFITSVLIANCKLFSNKIEFNKQKLKEARATNTLLRFML